MTVCCAGRPATRYQAAREPLPRVPTAFQGSKCVRGGLQGTRHQVKARYQVRANALLSPEPEPDETERVGSSISVQPLNGGSLSSPEGVGASICGTSISVQPLDGGSLSSPERVGASLCGASISVQPLGSGTLSSPEGVGASFAARLFLSSRVNPRPRDRAQRSLLRPLGRAYRSWPWPLDCTSRRPWRVVWEAYASRKTRPSKSAR